MSGWPGGRPAAARHRDPRSRRPLRLWNKQYSEIYSKTADLFAEGARLEDTLRVGVARGDYPEAAGHEDEWIAERLKKLYEPGKRHEQTLSDGRVILIEERRTDDGGVVGLRVDITELKQRELVPPAVRRQPGSHDRLRAG